MPTIVVGLPLYKPQALLVYEAESRVSVDDARPEAVGLAVSVQSVRTPIVKLPFELLVVPPADAATPFTVSAPPVGAVVSLRSVSVAVAELFPAASVALRSTVGELVVPALQEKRFESYGPPAGVEIVPAVCVQPVDVPPSALVVEEAGPEPPSATVFRTRSCPAAAPR